MLRTILLLFCIGLSIAQGQKIVPKKNPSADTMSKVATADVTVTDFALVPRAGEQVIFRGESTGKIFSGITDAAGKYRQLLPPGDKYFVSIKSFSDTNTYAAVNIPALQENQYYTDPFTVNIKFEPAKTYKLNHVHFDVDKATLRPDSYPELKELLDYLQRHPSVNIEIAGHTDNTGTEPHNLKLSQDRANTIKNYLVGKGIKATRLTAKGYGATQPVADNATEEGKQKNRRTEVRLM